MENFFIDDEFYGDLGDFCDRFADDDEVFALPEDYSEEVIVGSREKIFDLTMDHVCEFILERTDRWEDRFPEEADSTFEKIKKAIKLSVDIDKLNENLPYLYYPSKEKATITKKDLIEYIS